MPQLRRLVARRMPAGPDAVAAALCEVRRRGWVGRLLDGANRGGRPWVRRTDAAAAAASVERPDADEATLGAALDRVLAERLRAAGPTPERALDAVATETAEGAGGANLSADAHAALARDVAAAHGLGPDAAARFTEAAAKAREDRAREQRAAGQAARETRRAEVRRLRDWERGLLDPGRAAALLGASEPELLRWAREGRVPTARAPAGAAGATAPNSIPPCWPRCVPAWPNGAPRPVRRSAGARPSDAGRPCPPSPAATGA